MFVNGRLCLSLTLVLSSTVVKCVGSFLILLKLWIATRIINLMNLLKFINSCSILMPKRTFLMVFVKVLEWSHSIQSVPFEKRITMYTFHLCCCYCCCCCCCCCFLMFVRAVCFFKSMVSVIGVPLTNKYSKYRL